MKNAAKWIWLADACGVGSADMMAVCEKYGRITDVYLADYDSYIENGISERLAERLSQKSLENAYSIIKFCEERNIGLLTYSDDEYPKSLRSIKDPPVVLYYVGRLPDFNRRLCIATVGTRKMSEYGMRSAYKIAYEVASSGAIVVSGMALGIDAVSASATLAAGGITVAVLGSGIDVVYPKEHTTLYNAIAQSGAVLTEYPPSTAPRNYNFPKRNRIISGLCQGTVVIDAAEKSGSLITARTAILQGRDVFAVPSNIDAENSSGTNTLIRDGAQAVMCGYDIVKNYSYIFGKSLDVSRLKETESSSLDYAVLSRYGVRARGCEPAYEGVSAKVERELGGEREIPKKTNSKRTDKPDRPEQKVKTVSDGVREQSDTGDDSRALLESLGEKERRIFEELPLDRAVPSDYLINLGFRFGEVMSALTKLEIKGFILCLPGGLFMRK